MRKIISIFLMGILFSTMVGVCLAKSLDDNPIDNAFANDFKIAQNTVELNYVNEKYLNAWQDELNNAAEILKSKYKFKDDKENIDKYLASYQDAAKAAGKAEWLNWSDYNSPPDDRMFGTGAASASMAAEAKVYKQATCNLIDIIKGLSGEVEYKYLYSGKGAELDAVK